jgi:transposase
LWREAGRKQLESFRLAPWASRRRRDLLELLDRLTPTIAELTQAIEQEVEKCPEAKRLMTHPGVGPLTALAFVLIIEKAERFECSKQIACYLGLVPVEESSGDRRRLGHITKQGNSRLRFLLVEGAQVTVRSIPEWRSKYFHLAMRRGRKIAKIAMARRLAVAHFLCALSGRTGVAKTLPVATDKLSGWRINFSFEPSIIRPFPIEMLCRTGSLREYGGAKARLAA